MMESTITLQVGKPKSKIKLAKCNNLIVIIIISKRRSKIKVWTIP